ESLSWPCRGRSRIRLVTTASSVRGSVTFYTNQPSRRESSREFLQAARGHTMLRSLFNNVPRTHKPDRNRFVPSVLPLEAREVPAVTASFNATTHTLAVFGDANNNTIVVSRTAAGVLQVNNGNVKITGGKATVANTTKIRIESFAGND